MHLMQADESLLCVPRDPRAGAPLLRTVDVHAIVIAERSGDAVGLAAEAQHLGTPRLLQRRALLQI
jgi:hypothetical protein